MLMFRQDPNLQSSHWFFVVHRFASVQPGALWQMPSPLGGGWPLQKSAAQSPEHCVCVSAAHPSLHPGIAVQFAAAPVPRRQTPTAPP